MLEAFMPFAVYFIKL